MISIMSSRIEDAVERKIQRKMNTSHNNHVDVELTQREGDGHVRSADIKKTTQKYELEVPPASSVTSGPSGSVGGSMILRSPVQ